MPAMRAGSYEAGELWLRCPYCGDSQTHRNKAHFSVNTSGVYYCFRCNKGGRLSIARLVDLYAKAGVFDLVLNEDRDLDPEDFKTVFESLTPGPATSRKSALDRFQFRRGNGDRNGLYDVFTSRKPSGELIGLALAGVNKTRRIIGGRGFGFKGEELVSDPHSPLRLVEGPYDVLSSRDVCVYGTISRKHMQELKTHCLILCPDGDVWTDDKLKYSFLRCLKTTKWGASIVGVEILPDGLDPDEVPYADRELLTPTQALRL